MIDGLKPCPFCGAHEIGHSLGKSCGRHVCMICCAQGPLVESDPETEKFWVEMQSEWNSRADLEASASLTTPATDAQALANPKVKKLVKAAILDAQLRAWERGRIDTPDEIEAAALAQLKEGDEG